MPALGNHLDFNGAYALKPVIHPLSTAPTVPTPVKGQLYFNTTDNTLYVYDGSTWYSTRGSGTPPDATAAVKGLVQLAGDLSGTAAAPTVANNAITSAKIVDGTITDSDVNAANKDGVAGVASLRTLGTGAQQATAGNDARLSDSRAPTAHKTTHEPGGSDPLTVDAAGSTGSLRTLGAGGTKAMPGAWDLSAIAAATPTAATVNMNGNAISGVADPISANQAATKQYVDNTTQGLDAKASAKAATTANIANLAGGAPNTVDGVALSANDRVLVKDQSTTNQNGIYTVTTLGTGANGTWARAADMDSWAEVPSAYLWVEQGTTQADTGWVSTADQGGTLGTTAITWTQFSGAGQITSGAGLTKTGNSLDVGAGSGIQVNADSVQVAPNGIDNTMIADGAINLASADVTGTLPASKGGTGQTSLPAGGLAGYYSSATHGAGTTITITQATHGLRASRGLQVQCLVEATGAMIEPDIVVAANGDVTVTFAVSQSANAIRTTIIG